MALKVLAGSDLPVATGVPPIHDELVELVRAGMTPLETLQASTRNASEFLGRLASEGTVEVGKKANLVLHVILEDPEGNRFCVVDAAR
jgi:imidazolonepropionase-like amidohydrolase